MQEHKYLKVIGQIKDYEGKKILVATWVHPLNTGNELTHHMLQVIYSAEKNKRQSNIEVPPIAQMTGGKGDSIKEQVVNFIKKEQVVNFIKNNDRFK